MKFKKISILIMIFTIFCSYSTAKAEDVFIDNNALSSFNDSTSSIIISEYNSGKIISKQNENKEVSVEKLPAYLASFLLAQQLNEEKLILNQKIDITGTDSILANYGITTNISVKDALFLLENDNSDILISSIFDYLGIDLKTAKQTIKNLSLNNAKLASLTINKDNTISAKELTFLVNQTVKNYPGLLDITKNPTYTLESGVVVQNSVNFSESDTMRILGLSYSTTARTSIAYSGNTRILITVLNSEKEKNEFFESLNKTYEYIFNNYTYKLALAKGEYTINNEQINIENDIYDLFYNTTSLKDVTYLLMNNKILLFQNYSTISANDGTTFSEFTSNSNYSPWKKIKNTFTNDDNFNKKTNFEKTNILINRGRYFATAVLLVYSIIFIILHILKNIVKRG